MDALRLERLVWSVLFAAFVAIPVGLLLAPDPTGLVPYAVATAAFLVTAPLAFRMFEFSESPTARAGDMTARFVTFFAVAVALRVALGAVGFDGFVGTLVSLAAGWLAASYVSSRLTDRVDEGGTGA